MFSVSRRFLLLLVCAAFVSSIGLTAAAQPGLPGPDRTAQIADLQRVTQGHVRIDTNPDNGLTRFVGTDRNHPIPASGRVPSMSTTPEQASRSFLSTYGSLFGLRNVADLTVRRSTTAEPDRAFTRFQQTYRGVPVLGGELVVQTLPDGATLSANGELMSNLAIDTKPGVAAAAAQQTAIAAIAKYSDYDAAALSASSPELWIYHPALLGAPGPRIPALVWRTEVRAGALDPLRELVLIDAHTGGVALHFNQIADAKQRLVCDNNNSTAQPLACTPPRSVRSEGQGPTGVQDVNLAYDYSGNTYDYYFNNFGRDSLNAAGLPLASTVRYCPNAANCPYENAFWNGAQMVYGDGYASADDVVGHELTHGFTDFSSSLFYYQQSGAINEAISDIFGEIIDQSYDGPSDNDTAGVRWLLGEDLGAIRNMQNPPAFNDPDRMTSPLFFSDPNEIDGGGVHINSGVANKTAYLMVDGATFNGRTVTGIGLAKAGRIWYEANNNYLISGSDYADLYNILRQSCTSLIGIGGISAADCQEVTDAVDATEMNQNPPNSPTAQAAMCGSGTPLYLYFDNMENTSGGNWAAGTVTGAGAWFYPQIPNVLGFDATYATSGNYNIWGYNRPSTSDSFIAMTRNVALPAGAFLYFNHAHGFEDDGSAAYDGGIVEYSTNNGASWADLGGLFDANGYNGTISTIDTNPLKGRQAFVRESNGYGSSRANLGTLAGQNVRFRFRLGTDSSFDDYGWFIDDLRIYTCGAVTLNQKSYLPISGR